MKRTGTIVLLLGLAGLLYWFGNKAKDAIINGLIFVSAKITRPTFSGLNLITNIYITYRNEGPVILWMDSFDGELFYGDYPVSRLSIPTRISLPPGVETKITINGVIHTVDLAQNIVDLIKNKDYLNGFSIRGRVVVGGIPFNINYPLAIL